MGWTREELEASVKAYQEILRLENEGQQFVKNRIYEDLSQKFGRTSSAYRLRMHNISYIYSLMGRSWVTFLKPLPHVGANVGAIIEELILANEPS